MANIFSEFVGKLKEAIIKLKEVIIRFATDKKTKDAVEKTKDVVITTTTVASRQSKIFLGTEIGKNIAIPAVLGALIGIPLPVIGPFIGGLIGAAYGYYIFINRPVISSGGNAGNNSMSDRIEKVDVYAELAKLDVLKRSGTLSEEEFNQVKSELLKKK